MKISEHESAPKSTPRDPDMGLKSLFQSRRMLVGGGIVLLLALASWLWWPTGESEGVKYFTDGGDINQPVKDAKPLPSLYIPPRLVLDENEGDVDQYDPTLSADELTLIFVRGRAHPDVGADLYLARRASSSDPWGEPELLSEINTSHNEISPELSRDGRWLFFASNRPDGWGGYDIWISAREGDGWRVPLNVGDKVNTGYNEIDPAWFAKKEPGTFESGLYFASNRPKLTVAEPKAPRWEGTLRGHEPPKPDDYDIFLAKADLESGKKEADGEKTEDETGSASFLDDMPPVPTSALALKEAKRLNHVNTFAREGQPALTPGGEYLYFSSNRQEAQGNRKGRTDFDLYRAHAHLYTLGHNVPENVGPSINTVGDEMDPFLFSVTEEASLGLLFSSNRDEGDTTYQLYQSRTKPVVSMDVKKESPTPATDAGSGFTDWFKKYQWWILLLILALLALVWLLKKFLDEEQRRHLSLMQSCLLSSLMLHLLLAFLLSLWVISEAIYKVIKKRTPEISVQEKQLAQERMALNLREQTTQLPQIQTPLPAEQKSKQQPVVEVRPQHPSIEIETKQATSQSFAAQPQQVQPSPAKLDKLELIEPQSNSESTPQTLMIPLEESEPQAVDSQQLAQASNEVKMAKAQAQTETAIPQALTPKPVESQPTQKMMTEAKAVPTEVKIELTSLQTIKARLNIKPPAPQALTVPLEKSDPQAVDSQRLAQASSEVKIEKAQAKTEATIPKALPPRPVESQPKQLATAEVNAIPTEAKTALTPLQMTVAKLSVQQPTPQTLTVPLEKTDPRAVDGQQLAQGSSEVKIAKAQAQAETAIPQALTPIPVESQPTQQAATEAKATPTEARPALLPLQTIKVQLSLQPPTRQAQSIPLETPNPEQSTEQLWAQVPAGLKIDPKETAGSPSTPKVVPSLPVAGAKLDLTPSAVQQSARVVGNFPLQPLASAKSTTVPVVQQSIPSIKLEQPFMKSDAPAVELKIAKSNHTATAAVAAITRAGVPLTAATPESTVSPLRLESLPIKGASKSELTPKLLNFPGGVEMAKLPEVNLDVDIKLDSAPEHDSPMLLRDPEKRKGLIEQLGGSDKTEEAIKRALDWFTRNQKPDGHWDAPGGHYAAATGMAMLAYMGWGAKHTEPGPYQEPLKKAMEWMMKTERNGDLRGSNGHNFMYDHGIAAIAMAEAYSLTKDPRLRPVVDRVVGFTIRAQNPKTGGWRYKPYEENGYRDRGDMSVTGWQIMALKSAQFGGIDVPLESLDKALKYMDNIGGGKRKSIYGYTSKGNPKPAMVSEGMFCHQLLRQHAIDQHSASPQDINLRLEESSKYIEKNLPNPRRLKYNYYYWYYACLALHQQQGPIWESWNARMRPVFLKAQVKRPGQAALHGSWDPIGEWGPQAGRCIITGMATLSLEVYYRYLPMYNPNQD